MSPFYRKIFILVLIVAFLGVFMFVYFMNTGLGRCYLIARSNFIQTQKNVFISPKMPKSLYMVLEGVIAEAKARNMDFWGEFTATPVVIFCADMEEYAQFTNAPQAPAMVYMSWLGAYIVAQPDGANVDVIAHEYCHAQLQKKLGWWKKYTQIPAWFDEGLALQLDYRYPNSTQDNSPENYTKIWNNRTKHGKNAPKLKELVKISQFFNNKYSPNIAYLTAGFYVSNWLEKVGKKGFLECMEKIKSGKDFDKVIKMGE